MNSFDPEGVRAFVRNYLFERLTSEGRDLPVALDDDCDLLVSGVIDSFGMLELMTACQEYCGRDIDFEALDPELMTIVGPLCDFVAGQMAEG